MEKNLYLLSEILDLSSSTIKAVLDSGAGVHELIFSDSDYLRERLKLDKTLVSKISAIKKLISSISLEELQKRKKIKGVKDAVKYLRTVLRTLTEEHLIVLFLNKGNALVDQMETKGSLDEVQADYRLIARRALVSEAAGVICAHNHPSGNANPSFQDRFITSGLKKKTGTFQY